MAADRLVVFIDATGQVKPLTNQSSVISVAQSIMGGTAGFNLEGLHSGFQRLLGIGTIRLRIENHLRVVPSLCPAQIQRKQLKILPQNANIIKAPGEEHWIFSAPGPKLLHRFREGNALSAEPGFLDASKLADPAI